MEFPNWFNGSPAQGNFNKFLEPFKGQDNLKFLQLGAYTGDASVWLLNNVLTGKSSTLTDIDTWKGSNEIAHHSMDFSEVEKVYDDKTKGYDNLIKYKGTTIEFLKVAPFDYYDFIYVDADHTAASVLIDAELSFLSLMKGGVLAFDDYEWTEGKGPAYSPKAGIDTFINRHEDEIQILHVGWQLWLFKK